MSQGPKHAMSGTCAVKFNEILINSKLARHVEPSTAIQYLKLMINALQRRCTPCNDELVRAFFTCTNFSGH